MMATMPWSDSPDYQRPVRFRDVLGITGLIVVALVAYKLAPGPHVTPSSAAARAR